MELGYSEQGATKESFDELSESELEYFREQLLSKKRELLKESQAAISSGKLELDSNEMKDDVDLASINIEHSVTFQLLDRKRNLLNEIEYALAKIPAGDYGFCEGTGDLIPRRRLELTPWVRYSVAYKSQLEKGKQNSHRGVRDEDD